MNNSVKLKNIADAKDKIVRAASRGSAYYWNNIILVALVLLLTLVITNFNDITVDPVGFFKTFWMDGATMWVVVLIFIMLLCLFYVARSLWNDKRNGDMVNNYKTAMKAFVDEETTKHNELARKRMEAGPVVSSVLKDLILDLGATRAVLCEMHNGTNNLNGIPFLYADAVYEEIVRTADYVTDEYKNFNMARYPFIGNHFYDQIWIGTRDDIEAEDPHLAAKLKYTGAEFGALQVIQGLRAPLGFLAVTYDAMAAKNKPSKTLITQKMDIAAQKICMLLSTPIEDERELKAKTGTVRQYSGR